MNAHQIHQTPTAMDERVNKILAYIHKNYTSDKFTLDDLSGLVFLSPSRLAYLFKMQTGSSISKYLVWTRIRHAISLILTKKDHSMSRIAHASGFYDAPQMNKYMYEMFGITPSRLRQKSDLIQAVVQPTT
jgi:AraC-like DNA-binding protein